MTARRSVLSRTRWALPLVVLLVAAKAFAQSDEMPTAFLGGFLVFFVICFLVIYVYVALALQTIAKKTNTENGWLAWIPIANIFLMLMVAKKPLWWFILVLIPLVNIVIYILVWMGIAEARSKPSWWGILIIVPIANLIVPGYLAWAD